MPKKIPVFKYFNEVNKPKTERDRTKYTRKDKHKRKEDE